MFIFIVITMITINITLCTVLCDFPDCEKHFIYKLYLLTFSATNFRQEIQSKKRALAKSLLIRVGEGVELPGGFD